MSPSSPPSVHAPRQPSCLVGVACVLAALLGLAAAPAWAEQSSGQQKCLNDMNKRGSAVAKEQNKAGEACLKNAAKDRVERLGGPAQSRTAQDCLRNDVKGKVLRRIDKLEARELSNCLSDPLDLPDFGYVDSSVVAGAAEDEPIALVHDLFGPSLSLAVILRDEDKIGAKCQEEVLDEAQAVYDALWKVARAAKKNGLKGKGRLTGGDPSAPLENAAELADEITAYVASDYRGKVSKAEGRLLSKAQAKCLNAVAGIAEMFPGVCGDAADIAELVGCAAARARTHFYRSLRVFDDLEIDCDLLDDGLANATCTEAVLQEHVLNRLGYGPDAWSQARIEAIGVEAYILEQLDPNSIDDSALDAMLTAFPSLEMSFLELRTNYPKDPDPNMPGRGQVLKELQRAKVLRAVASRRQLEEVLVDFWFNHFNVMTAGGRRKWDISPYEGIAIRPYVLGQFAEIVLANARSPAMGDYLDNRRNKVNDINENYGRELLELHTLSVDGGYTEHDVVDASRVMTGWREDYAAADGFEFRESWHDQDAKIILNVLQIPANGGYQDGLDLIDFLATHPSTADFISRKLIRRFVSDVPPEPVVTQAVQTFLATAGDLRAVLETILLSPDFLYEAAHRRAKVRRPHQFFAALARATGSDPALLDLNKMRNGIRDLGEELYKYSAPTGYPDLSSYWSAPGTLVLRFNQAEDVARRKEGFSFSYPVSMGSSTQIADALIDMLFIAGVSDATRDMVVAFLGGLVGATDEERIEQAAALLLSSPEFLLH